MSRNHTEVCHLWASGNKADAKGFNIYFEGREIFSYGSHFLLGFRMGPSLFFLNSSGYSISTSKHKSYVWRAAHGEIFHVPNLTALRHELRTVARFREGKADKAEARRAGARMIAALAPMIGEGGAWKGETVSRDAVERLATESGFTAKQAASAIDKAAGAAARKAESNARRLAAAERAEAIAESKVAPAEWQARLARDVENLRTAGTEWIRRDALHRIKHSAKEATRLHRIATRAKLGKRTVARLWAIVKAHRAALADHERKAGMRARLASFASHKAAMRDNLAKVAAMPDSVEKPGYVFGIFRAISTNAALMRNVRFMRPDTSARLSAIIRWADARNEWESAESARIANARKAAEIAEWRAGGNRRVYFDSDHGGAAIRATGVQRDESGAIVGGTLETSHGATVPLAHAIRVFRFLKLMRERGEEWRKNGRTIRVGHYSVDVVRPDGGFTAGCHRFAWPEIETLALALGVFDVAPADVREPSQAAA